MSSNAASTGGAVRWPDLGHPDTFKDGIPHSLLAEMRREAPVVWIDEPESGAFPGGPGFWAVLRHAEVAHVSRHPDEFSSWLRTSFLRDPQPSDVAVLRRMMLNMDPPQHTKLRKIVNRAFTPQVLRRQLQASIETHARAVVDAVCEKGEIDFLEDVAAEMPLLVLADILGVPRDDRHLLYSWTNRLVGLDDPEYGGDPEACVSAFTELFAGARAPTQGKRWPPTRIASTSSATPIRTCRSAMAPISAWDRTLLGSRRGCCSPSCSRAFPTCSWRVPASACGRAS